MRQFATRIAAVGLMLTLASLGMAQSTTNLSVAVGPEAALTVSTGTTAMSTNSTSFGSPFTGTTALTYQIRTTKSTGTGTITVKITTDFSPTGGPSVNTPPAPGDALSYTCTVVSPGTACTGSVNASIASYTSVGTFGAG